MHPVVRDKVCRIGYEAIRNASAHSEGSRVEVLLSYGNDFSVRVRDNGVGIDPRIAETGKDGHFGLQGMRERAARISARLTVVSSASSGTEIKLVLPGRIVFSMPSSPRWTGLKPSLRKPGETDPIARDSVRNWQSRSVQLGNTINQAMQLKAIVERGRECSAGSQIGSNSTIGKSNSLCEPSCKPLRVSVGN